MKPTTATILGTGPSLQPWYNAFDGTKKTDYTIGVNDILSHVSSDAIDAIAFVDGKGAFTAARWKMITENNLPKYTWLYGPDIQGLPNLTTLPVEPWKNANEQFYNPQKVYYGTNSVFFAIHVAIHLGATEIEVHGCDIVDHPQLSQKLQKVVEEFKQLIHLAAYKRISITWSTASPLQPYLAAEINTAQKFLEFHSL